MGSALCSVPATAALYLEIVHNINATDLLLVNLACPDAAIIVPGLLIAIRTLSEMATTLINREI
jgi:hypothetical protein